MRQTKPLSRRTDVDRYRVAGQCRHCGFREEWVIEIPDLSTRKTILDAYFPVFMRYCDECNNMAVFDLTAFTAIGHEED